MGFGFEGRCRNCGNVARFNEGGGFFFHLLHCAGCGAEKRIGFDDLGEIHLRYLKGLSGPYAIISMERDEWVRNNHPGKPLTRDQYYAEIERMVGTCSCGGPFSMTTPNRCPKCLSSDIENTGNFEIDYD